MSGIAKQREVAGGGGRWQEVVGGGRRWQEVAGGGRGWGAVLGWRSAPVVAPVVIRASLEGRPARERSRPRSKAKLEALRSHSDLAGRGGGVGVSPTWQPRDPLPSQMGYFPTLPPPYAVSRTTRDDRAKMLLASPSTRLTSSSRTATPEALCWRGVTAPA